MAEAATPPRGGPASGPSRDGSARHAPTAENPVDEQRVDEQRVDEQRVDEQGAGEQEEMGRRGSLHLADAVVEKIAQTAALEVRGVAPGAETTSRFGAMVGRGYPDADVDLAGTRGRVTIQVATQWPAPAARVAADVRDTVARRLRELAAVEVDSVAVSVAAVVRPSAPQEERVR